jgi:hypothetical protein
MNRSRQRATSSSTRGQRGPASASAASVADDRAVLFRRDRPFVGRAVTVLVSGSTASSRISPDERANDHGDPG